MLLSTPLLTDFSFPKLASKFPNTFKNCSLVQILSMPPFSKTWFGKFSKSKSHKDAASVNKDPYSTPCQKIANPDIAPRCRINTEKLGKNNGWKKPNVFETPTEQAPEYISAYSKLRLGM